MKRTALLRRVGGINDWQSPRDDPARMLRSQLYWSVLLGMAASTPWTWKTDFAMSRPIVVTACMSGSSESWKP
jgi:hypothetical protein